MCCAGRALSRHDHHGHLLWSRCSHSLSCHASAAPASSDSPLGDRPSDQDVASGADEQPAAAAPQKSIDMPDAAVDTSDWAAKGKSKAAPSGDALLQQLAEEEGKEEAEEVDKDVKA